MNDADKPSVPTPESAGLATNAAAQPPIRAPQAAPAPPPEEGKPAVPKPGPVPELEDKPGRVARLKQLDAEIEGELEAAMGGMSEKDIFGEPARRRQPATGQPPGPKKGKVLTVRGNDVFVDVPGGRSQGVLSLSQFPEGVPPVGTEVEIEIEGYDSQNGLLILTRKGAAVQAEWSTVAEGMTVEARVTETNKGGLTVDVNGIRGFMPISQIDLYRVENPEQYVNQRLLCLVTEVNPEERNLVVSRRALLDKEREEKREKLWQELAEGQVREGVVRSVRDFGAFVDLGGVDGLLHVSEMSWQRVNDVSTIVQPGQTVKVVVLKIDREARKVGLGLKQLTASPWEEAAAKYPIGASIKGTVTRLMDFGAFVELEPGLEGLIHISELANQRVHRVSDVVQPGQEVQATVLRVDPAQKRISLSLKAVKPKEEEAPAEEAPPEEPPPEAKKPRPRTTPLRGGVGGYGPPSGFPPKL